ncbi:glycosyltransferase [Bdellovibrionota bacterium FG-2]
MNVKVLHLAKADDDGGAAKAAYRIHRGLVNFGINSRMLVGCKSTDDPRVLGPRSLAGKLWGRIVPHLDAFVTRFLTTRNTSLHSPSIFGSFAVQRIRKVNPDIINLHWVCGGFLRPESFCKFGVPLVWRLADMWAFSGAEHYVGISVRYQAGYLPNNRDPGESGFDLNRWVWERKLKSWEKVPNLTLVAPSNWMAKCARKSVLFKDRRIEVIHTGQNLDLFKPRDRMFSRDLFGLPQNKKIILFGSMSPAGDPRKGFEYLQAALRELSKAGWSDVAEIAIFGASRPTSPPDFGFKTHYIGKLQDDASLAVLYPAADVFVAPSIEENLANTVIEAIACGVPTVCFDVGGMPDAIIHRKNGYLAECFDSKDLANGISWILEDKERWQDCSKAARLHAEKMFCEKRQAQEFIRLYESILKNK